MKYGKYAIQPWLIALIVPVCLAMCKPAPREEDDVKVIMDQITQAFDDHDYEKALQLCTKALELFKTKEDKGEYNPMLIQTTKLALCLTGKLLENVFAYNRYLGFFEPMPAHELVEYISLDIATFRFLSAVGLQSMAMISAFDRFDVTESPSALNDFIQSAIIAGDYRVAKTAVNRLAQHKPWQKQVQTYKALLADTAAIHTDPFYSGQRKLRPKTDFQINWFVDNMITKFHFSNPDNQRVFEYVMGLALVQKINILQDIDSLLFKFKYTHIPRHLEEAILVQSGYGIDPEISRGQMMKLTFGGLAIRQQTILRHEQFLIQLDLLQQNPDNFEAFQKAFSDMYQYYLIASQTTPEQS